MSRQFLPHIEFLRAFAIIFVVFTHLPWPQGSPLGLVLFTFFQNGTVFFIFISGFLFTFLNGASFDFRGYLEKKVRFVILPYLILSALFLTINAIFFGSRPTGPLQVLTMLIQGAPIQVQFWFIPMITLFFLSAPLFRLLSSRTWGIALLAVTLPVSILTWRPWGQLNAFYSFIHFFGIYHLGTVAGSHREAFDRVLSRPRVLVASALAFLGFWWLEFLHADILTSAVFEDIFTGKWRMPDLSVLQKLALLALVYGLSVRLITARRAAVKLLAEYSFGIFFLHLFFLNLQMLLYPHFQSTPVCLVFGVIAIALSMAVVWLIKLPTGKHSRYIVGC